jgi:O-antigen/teichoic acid export membrane protein
VFGPGRYAADTPGYLKLLLHGHWLAVGGCSVLLVLAGLLCARFRTPEVGHAFLGLAVAVPFVLLSWMLRRACYIQVRPEWAAAAGALYLVLLTLGIVSLHRFEMLSSMSALGMMAAASALASVWLTVRLQLFARGTHSELPAARIRWDHWSYGRWAAGTGALAWVPENLYLIVLPLWNGLVASGVLKVLITLTMPAMQAQGAVANLLTPALVRARGGAGFGRLLRAALGGFAITALACWLLIGAFHRPLVHWLYGGQYDEYSALLWLAGAIPLLSGVGEALSDALRALERPDLAFWAAVGSCATTVSLGLGAAALWGVAGAVMGEMISLATAAALMGVFLARSRDRARRDRRWMDDVDCRAEPHVLERGARLEG